MKKTVSILLCIVLMLAFTSCAKDTADDTGNHDNEAITESESGIVFNDATNDSPAVYAVVSNDTPAVGEEVVIDVRLSNVDMFCSIDLSLEYNSNALTIKYVGKCDIPDIMDIINVENGNVTYSGLVMRSANVTDETLFKITATPKDGASGLQTIKVNSHSLLISLDADGNATVDMSDDLITTDILLSVQ